ncbi:FAD/NAD(P)-binding protein [Lichenihabitans sp. Uapishka_5]|uniref:FAD/NAD(P)-binding protein n=1 Tax=Lichenihabitans sp. Uapishka_5 TaxID=3037302 RepID=UPI0029E8256E|nr:FAD/NAD(P)-binding protein [Lichenihabitans sp. Uapishka_5]MDX7952849.1 FAD/NAD(P)-binding protein [Lichenihabitans sp. Uapishka_5]
MSLGLAGAMADHPAGRATRILVIGGGFTGVALALHLIRATDAPLHLVLVDPSPEPGRGIAYATPDPEHRINVPSDRMGLFADDPHAFTRWLFAQGHLPDDGSHDGAGHFYVPRQLYGSFMADQLGRAVATAGEGRVRLEHRRARVVALAAVPGGWEARLDDGTQVTAEAAALCLGHAPPQPPCRVEVAALNQAGLVSNPWSPGALRLIAADAAVLVVGTGLTMADVIASLSAAGHRGPVTAVSRRGLVSRPHGAFDQPFDILGGAPLPRTALELLRLLRRCIATATQDWTVVVDALRSHLPELWGALPAAEQRRVLHRLLPFWEVHRFRIAPQLQAAIQAAEGCGSLRIERAALTGLDHDGARFQATLRRHGGATEQQGFDAVVLCTGPRKGVAADPLAARLLADGVARLDAVGVGLAVDRSSRVLAPDGTPHPSLLALGPITRGSFGEMTGAPDIAKHLEAIAGPWLASLVQHPHRIGST